MSDRTVSTLHGSWNKRRTCARQLRNAGQPKKLQSRTKTPSNRMTLAQRLNEPGGVSDEEPMIPGWHKTGSTQYTWVHNKRAPTVLWPRKSQAAIWIWVHRTCLDYQKAQLTDQCTLEDAEMTDRQMCEFPQERIERIWMFCPVRELP